MSHLFRKVVLFLVFLIAVLQIIHMSLMSRLESRTGSIKNNHNHHRRSENILDWKTEEQQSLNVQYSLDDVAKERDQMYRSLQSLSSVLDSSGEYRIMSFLSTADFFKSSRWRYSIITRLDTLDGQNHMYKQRDLAIVTHSTVFQLHNLDLLSRRWNGPISVSIFAVSIQQLPIAVEVILFLRFCSHSIRQRTSFHLVYPLNFSSKLNNRQVRSVLDFLKFPDIKKSYPEFETFITEDNCQHIKESIERLAKRQDNVINYNHHVPYPNNLLRNIARRYALTEYTLVIDVDLVPSDKLYERFSEFAQRTKHFKETNYYLDHGAMEDKIVFVLPTFEIDLARVGKKSGDENIMVPKDKAELIRDIEQRFIRPFYIELCWKCHKYTDYEAWLHASSLVNHSSPDLIDILYEVSWHDPWEPFYISRNNVPLYDERFRQYGFNRISQTCELNVAGYRFSVLNNAFLIHKGYKTSGNFHPKKDVELERNRALFRKFKLQLKERYPNSNRRC